VPMLEGKIDHVIGIDTHRDHHAAAILDRNGGQLAQLEIPTNQAGYARLLAFIAERAPGRRCWGLEGPAATAPGWPASWPSRASGWPRSTGPSAPGAATAPRATRWTPSGPAGKH
jgi:hypothetical protein